MSWGVTSALGVTATAITEDEKKAKKEEENQRMKEIAKVRDAMRTTYSEWRAEGLSAEGTEEDKKRKGTDSRYCPAESKKRITVRLGSCLAPESRNDELESRVGYE